jgi:ribosomal protein S18 acetylase RimI-like enzyme
MFGHARMSFEIVPAANLPLPEQARIANTAFAGYVAGWSEMDAAALGSFLCLQGADLRYSRFIRVDGELAGFGYINRTGNFPRVSGMALIPSARGTGAASHLLLHLLGEARERGDAAMILEVIEQNPRALAFYRRHGFREIGHLLGWRRLADGNIPSANEGAVIELPVLEALRRWSEHSYPDIPWQISPFAIAKVEKARAFRSGEAHVVIGDPTAQAIRIHGLFTANERLDGVRAALARVLASFAGREFFCPAIWPEQFGAEIFEPLGFRREPLSQFLMRKDCA